MNILIAAIKISMQRCCFLLQNPDFSLLLNVLLGNKGLDIGALSRLLISYVFLMPLLLTFLEMPLMQINSQKRLGYKAQKITSNFLLKKNIFFLS